MAFSAKDVKALRDATNAGMMDCKKALTENDGDFEKAATWLREKGIADSAKRADREANQGRIESYIHMGGSFGVLVEINCETDFVAKTDAFIDFCKDVCLQICSADPKCVSKEDMPRELMEAELEIYKKQAADTGKPEEICKKIAEGRLNKWYKEACLLEQKFVKDDSRTIEELMKELSGKLGEKVNIRRFVRFQLGEGV